MPHHPRVWRSLLRYQERLGAYELGSVIIPYAKDFTALLRRTKCDDNEAIDSCGGTRLPGKLLRNSSGAFGPYSSELVLEEARLACLSSELINITAGNIEHLLRTIYVSCCTVVLYFPPSCFDERDIMYRNAKISSQPRGSRCHQRIWEPIESL